MPSIINITKQGKEVFDLVSYDFIENRTIHIVGEINDSSAAEFIIQLQYLKKKSNEKITIYINSPGGSVSSGLAIIDAIKRCKCPVSTVCTGIAASMAALILSCGNKGMRYVTPLSEVMIHQPLGGVQGQASDVEVVADHIVKTKRKLNEILSSNTGKSIKKISSDSDRDYYMSAEQAIKYGIADKILTKDI